MKANFDISGNLSFPSVKEGKGEETTLVIWAAGSGMRAASFAGWGKWHSGPRARGLGPGPRPPLLASLTEIELYRFPRAKLVGNQWYCKNASAITGLLEMKRTFVNDFYVIPVATQERVGEFEERLGKLFAIKVITLRVDVLYNI